MDGFLQEWNAKFGHGVLPPEWVFQFSADDKQQSQNVGRKIAELETKTEELRKELDHQLFVLSWLKKARGIEVPVSLQEPGFSQGSGNHVQGELEPSDEVFVQKDDSSSVLSESSLPEEFFSPTEKEPGTSISRLHLQHTELTSRSEESPNSSEYFTAGQSPDTSLTNLVEERFSPPWPVRRHRLTHPVDSKDGFIAKAVHLRVLEGGRHWSCQNLSGIGDNNSLIRKSPVGKRRRIHSAPSLSLDRNTRKRLSTKTKKRVQSSPCTALSSDNAKSGLEQPSFDDTNHVTPQDSNTNKVILRDKTNRRPSFTMNPDENLKQWREDGGTSVVGVKRSSNGYNFVIDEDQEDNDPALLNVMASHLRGTLRGTTQTASEGESPTDFEKGEEATRVDNGGGVVALSPNEDHSNTPVPKTDSVSSDSNFKSGGMPPVDRKRSLTNESSPVKRFSYHYSDDECLTPKLDADGPSGGSPFGNDSNYRNSCGSNGVIEEEECPYDLTLARKQEACEAIDRKNTITAESVGMAPHHPRHSETSGGGGDEEEQSSLTATLTSKGYSQDSGGGNNSDMAFFEPSDSYSFELGSLDIDIERTLSKLRNKPDMSMAALLDINENERMNARISHHMEATPEENEMEYGESIEIDEATISAFTLNSSRSNSANSLPGLFTDPPSGGNGGGAYSSPSDQESPSHSALQGVNLRHGGGKRSRRIRMENADLEKFTGHGRSDNDNVSPSPSHSSTSLNSEEESFPSSPLADENLSPGSRASRHFPVRHSTVVVHGEQLVIRKLVVVGVVSAEKSYIECLSVMKEYYRKPLLALTTGSQPILFEKDINTIFYRVEDLHQLHAMLHEQLEPVLSNWSVSSCVGGFFVQLCRSLKLYKDYVEMYQKSVECLSRNKTENPLFKKFLEDVHLTVTNTNKDIPKVNELLRRPIERLQSYSLVLTDLCQHTPKDHADHRILRESLQAMSAFMTSTHDPQAFRELSGGFNREMVKEGLVVELSEGYRKVRRLFLFHDLLVSAKQKPTRTSMKFEPKWYLPLSELSFKCPEGVSKKPVPVSSDMELSVMKNKIAELKAQLSQNARERSSSTSGEGFNIRRNIFMIKYGSNKPEKNKKKLQEQQVAYWIAAPSLPLRLYDNTGKQYMFLLHNEEESEQWISSIKKLIPKASSVSLTSFELQDLLSRQTINDLRKVEEMIVPMTDDDYLSGVLRVRVMSANDLKAKLAGLYCCLELDEYGKFERKARTLPTNTDGATLITTWDQDFELELAGAHTMKVQICSKSLLKEETYAHGKIGLPIKELKQNKRQKMKIPLAPQGFISLVIEYFSNMASVSRKPSLLSSGVFGVPIEVVAKRERHDIPLIVQTCVDEVERRGLDEVGVYRVAGVLRDVIELRQTFDTDYIKAQVIAFETDIHAVAGLLKRYFRELPDPLFTEELYESFVLALGLSDPEARDQCLLSLLHSLPPVNFKTAVFLFKHLRAVAANSSQNKMTFTNLATIFGLNLLRPGPGSEVNISAMDVVTPVSVVLYYLNCPLEYFDEGPNRTSPESMMTNASGGSSGGEGKGGAKGEGSGGRSGGEGKAGVRKNSGEEGPTTTTTTTTGAEGGGVVIRRGSNQFKSEEDFGLSGRVFRRSRRVSGRTSSGGSVRNTSSSRTPSSANVLTSSRESII